MNRYTINDLAYTNYVNPDQGIMTMSFSESLRISNFTARYLAMGIYKIGHGYVTALVTETGDLLEIEYRGYRIMPWGEIHPLGHDPRYNTQVDVDRVTLDDIFEGINEKLND